MEDVTSGAGEAKPRRRPAKSNPPKVEEHIEAPKKRTRAAGTSAGTVTARTASEAKAPAPRKRQPRKRTAATPAATPDATGDPQTHDVLTQLDRVLADLDPQEPPVEAAPSPPMPAPAGQKAPLWALIVADPGFAAEHVAREAIRRVGPEARDWVGWIQARYPDAQRDAIARLAASEYVSAARRQAAGAGSAGLAGSMAGIGVLARVQARLVLTVAAAYGFDPISPERARDLLDLMRVPRLTQPTLAAVRNTGRLVSTVVIRRVAARLIPFGGAIAGAVHGGRSTEDLAQRAIAHFRR